MQCSRRRGLALRPRRRRGRRTHAAQAHTTPGAVRTMKRLTLLALPTVALAPLALSGSNMSISSSLGPMTYGPPAPARQQQVQPATHERPGATSTEAVATRLAWGDYDQDGLQDLYRAGMPNEAQLLHNLGDGTFEDVTLLAGLSQSQASAFACWQDCDQDGRLDLLVGGAAGLRLWHATPSRTFEDITEAAGLVSAVSATSAAYSDFDQDGDADLTVDFIGGGQLYRNLGHMRFEEVLRAPGAAPSVIASHPGADASEAASSGREAPEENESPQQNRGSSTLLPPATRMQTQAQSAAIAAASIPTHIAPTGSPGFCADTVRDQASGSCVAVSSLPVAGSLLPLGEQIYVSPIDLVGIGTMEPNDRLTVQGGISMMGIDPNRSGGRILLLEESDSFLPASGAGGFTMSAAYPYPNGYAGKPRANVIKYDGNTILGTDENGHSLGNVGIGTADPNAALTVRGGFSVMGPDPKQSGGRILAIEGSNSFLPASGAGGFTMSAAYPYSTGYAGKPRANVIKYDGNTILGTDENGNSLGRVGVGTSSPSCALDVVGETSTSTLRIKGGADFVEPFSSSDGICEPGSVVVFDVKRPGHVRRSAEAYDARVAGVVSGAGGIYPGLVLGQQGRVDGDTLVALTGQVYVKCTAESGPILPGDRLVTSSTPGHAMKATDKARSDGAVVGKAAGSLAEGTGLVLVVVNLQ